MIYKGFIPWFGTHWVTVNTCIWKANRWLKCNYFSWCIFDRQQKLKI